MTKRLLSEVSAVLGTTPDRVFPLVRRDVAAMGHGTVAATESFATEGTETGGADGKGGADEKGGTVSLQGGWWYRGEWSVAAHPEGTLLVYRVYNVAGSPYWTVALANKLFIGYGKQTRRAAAASLARLGEELGCPARLL